MKKALFLLPMFLSLLLCAQDDPPVVAVGTLETDDYQWSFTVGDLAIFSLQTDVYCWTQGSQQPNINSVPVKQPELPSATMELYPNPTQDLLFCKVTMPLNQVPLHAGLFDATGCSLHLEIADIRSNEVLMLSLAKLPAGSYFIIFSDPEGHRIAKQFQKI